ncbi:unnamed protein product [Leuciscus chuanchicus]
MANLSGLAASFPFISFTQSLSLPLALSPCSRMLPFAQTPARQRNAVLALGSTNKRTGVAPAVSQLCFNETDALQTPSLFRLCPSSFES